MAKFQYTNHTDVTIESDATIPVTAPTLINFVKLFDELHCSADLERFDVVRDGVDLTKFSYEFKAKDGRVWKQVLLVTATEARMSFNVPDYWKIEEFVCHGLVRDVVIEMIRNFGLSKVRCR